MGVDLSTFDPTDANQAMEAKEAVFELQETVSALEEKLNDEKILRERVEGERDRYVARMKTLEKRIGFAMDIFSNKIKPPTINEIRKARGIEELPQLGKGPITVEELRKEWAIAVMSPETGMPTFEEWLGEKIRK